MSVPNVVENLNVRVFMPTSSSNETGDRELRETCICKFRLDASVFISKQRWDEDKCRCKYKWLIDKSVYDKGFFAYPSNCHCECDKSSGVKIVNAEKNCLLNWLKNVVKMLMEKKFIQIKQLNIYLIFAHCTFFCALKNTHWSRYCLCFFLKFFKQNYY